CYETRAFDTVTCAWVTSGTQPVEPTTALACYETRAFDTVTCAWVTSGTQPAEPTTELACYETRAFDTATCAWVTSGTQPEKPTVACYETVGDFNNDTCTWTVTGTQIIDKPVLDDVLGQCTATAEIPSTTNNCGESIIGTPQNPITYNIEGEYIITWVFESSDKTVSVTALQKVIVKDTEAPIAPTIPDEKGQCTATAKTPTAIDACEGNIIGKTDNDVIYNTQGTYEITWTFTDSKGNTSTAKQKVIVDETNPPTAPVLATITGSCFVEVPKPSIVDGCSQRVIEGTTTDELTYNAAGTYLISWTFDNGKGSVSAPQEVIVTATNTDTNGKPGYAKCNDDIDYYIKDLKYPTLESLLPEGTTAGGTWIDEFNPSRIVLVDGKEKFNPYEINTGDYELKYLTTNGACSSTVKVVMTVDDDCIVAPIGTCVIDVKNAFSPNGDALNEVFTILNIEDRTCFPTNTVEIYNRWGVLVFETNQYDNSTRVFRGISEGRATVNKSAELPTGTYFYIIQYTDGKG
ncbi:T9SS type B sorting domain-containing protein, partial [Flavobacterium luteum]